MSSRTSRVLVYALALFALSTLTRAAAPLVCPAGTTLVRGEKVPNGGTEDFCYDKVTGLPEGPMRQYRSDGSLEGEGANRSGKIHGVVRLFSRDGTSAGEMVYDRGEVTSTHLTLIGLQEIVEDLNAGYAASKEPNHLAVIDERTVMMTVQVHNEAKLSPAEKKQFQDTLRADPGMCTLFTVMGISVLNMHLQSLEGAELVDFSMTSAECAAAHHAH